jgi:hypothetical protein
MKTNLHPRCVILAATAGEKAWKTCSAAAAATLVAVFAWSARGAQYVIQPGPAESKDIRIDDFGLVSRMCG